jgi:chromosome segregation ATPase
MGDNFLEKLFCGRPISARDAYISANNVLNQEITGLRTDILSLEKEKQALIQAGNETQQQNLTQIDNLNKQISDLNAQISMLNAQLNQQLPSDL